MQNKDRPKNRKSEKTQKEIPLKEHGFLKGTSEAGFLVTQTLTGVAMLSWAVDSVTPVQVLLLARVDSFEGSWGGGGWGEWEAIWEEEEKGNGGNGEGEEEDWGSGFWFELCGSVKCHCNCNWSCREREKNEEDGWRLKRNTTARRVFVLLQKWELIKLNYFGQHVMHFNFNFFFFFFLSF